MRSRAAAPPRFLLEPEALGQHSAPLDPGDAHHATRVLRLQPGDPVEILDGAGSRWTAEIESASRSGTLVRLVSHSFHPRPPFQLVLAQALAKSRAMEWIVRKATELGVAEIRPLLTDHSVVHDPIGLIRKWDAWIREAMKQCGCPWRPAVRPPATVDEAARTIPDSEFGVFGDLKPDAPSIGDALPPSAPSPATAAAWIGPEGDFSEREKTVLRRSGIRPVTLGPWVLRSDTAAVCSLAVLAHELTRRHIAETPANPE